MPTYTYTARDEAGNPVNGTMQAASVTEVTQSLRAEGKYPTSVRPAGAMMAATAALASGARASRPSRGVKITRAELIQLSQQLAIMIETGVTIVEALDCVAMQTESPHVKKLVSDLSTQIQGGADFSAALAKHPRTFPQLYVALMKASEKSGMMSKLLSRATEYLRDEQETLRRVRGALTYPAIMLTFAVTTTIFLLAYVLPKFTVIYANKGAALPVPTQVLMAVSNVVIEHWPAILVVAGSMVLASMLLVRTRGGRRFWHALQLWIPLLGPMFKKLHLARGMRMIGTMAGAGVSLVDCVNTALDLCPNVHFRALWQSVSDQIQTGKQMSEPMRESNLVPPSISQMIHSGEKSGKLAWVLESVSAYSEQELKEKIADLTRYIEPAMIVIMGLIIGGVALALMLPIFTISRVVAN